MKKYPSIFNDVIGPIMRGPSSSHCAASTRIGNIARDLMGGNIQEVLIEYDTNGSLATTHESQGSDMGLFGGLLGWEAFDERLQDSAKAIKDAGISVRIEIKELQFTHPSTYKINLKNQTQSHQVIAISTGGGMMEIVEIDGIQVLIAGDYYETIIYTDDMDIIDTLQEKFVADEIIINEGINTSFVQVKGHKFMKKELINHLKLKYNISSIIEINPVLPVLSHKDMVVPFTTSKEMIEYNQDKQFDLWELAVQYESIRGNITPDDVLLKMKRICKLLKKSILDGIEGTEYEDRILGYQSGLLRDKMKSKDLLEGGILNQMILYITSLMEVKSSMGIIVASPTAGSCGTLPGSLIAVTNATNMSEDHLVRAMLASSMIGIFIAIHSTFSAEIGGCQAECGSASGMAAAGLVYLGGGNLVQAVNASSMALQNILGMVCDPVANRVEVPCLGKNVMAASNAFACANMALANYDPVIPLDEVIEVMHKVGLSIPLELRCTALGGLSITKTSKSIEKRLRSHKNN